MPELLRVREGKVADAMASGMQYFAIITDRWSSQASHSYISLTVHYISEHWEISVISWRLLNLLLTTLQPI